jgi:DNA-directed RNA polymerase specialized sigma24 family protein
VLVDLDILTEAPDPRRPVLIEGQRGLAAQGYPGQRILLENTRDVHVGAAIHPMLDPPRRIRIPTLAAYVLQKAISSATRTTPGRDDRLVPGASRVSMRSRRPARCVPLLTRPCDNVILAHSVTRCDAERVEDAETARCWLPAGPDHIEERRRRSWRLELRARLAFPPWSPGEGEPMAADIPHATTPAVSSNALEDASRQRADAAWVAGIRGGDEGALSDAFRAYAAPLVQCARRVVPSDARARDIVLDVFVHLWRDRLTLPADLSLGVHLHAAVHDAAMRTVAGGRAEAVRRECSTHTGWSPAISGPRQPIPAEEGEGGRAGSKAALRRAYGTLPAQLRRVMELHWCHGRSYEAIARELHVPVTSVDSYVAKGMQLLREALRDGR